ncbi:SLATT domain-containing protein [Eleftheria terrae]|uniref:SLATT domain-containing protein n=1 Tax=Eleftheria terrae TaxID=1597781 RepID=UPI00263BB4EF|nr:DUF4231 domain-containing protein [Eleftheria terrae]WKB55978.1 SLATT domain-containing protein [Eleftheria terrae]
MSENPEKFAQSSISGFKEKADHNKLESLACFLLVIGSSLLSPLFVTLGDGIIWGKIVPSTLSLVAAGSTAWLQLRKPQNLWSLYRDCQRRLEDHLYKFQYCLHEYATDERSRRQLLAEAVRKVAWEAHERWLPLVPTPEALGGASNSSAAPVIENDHATRA